MIKIKASLDWQSNPIMLPEKYKEILETVEENSNRKCEENNNKVLMFIPY